MRNSISRIVTLTSRNLKEILRDPLSLAFTIILPLVLEVLFYFLFHSFTEQFEMKYLAPSIVVFSQTFLSLFLGLLIANDRNSSFFHRLCVSRARGYEFIISYIVSLIPVCLLQSTLFFLIGGLFDVSLFKIEMIYSILLSLVSALFFLSVGVLIGCLSNDRSVGALASIVINAHSILSGMWFPIEGLNSTLLNVMEYLPFLNANKLLQNTINDLNNILSSLIIVVLYTFITFIFSIIIFRKKMKIE